MSQEGLWLQESTTTHITLIGIASTFSLVMISFLVFLNPSRWIVSLFSKGADGPARTARRPGYPPVKGLYQPFKMTY